MTYALWGKSRFGGTILCIECSTDLALVIKARDDWAARHGKWWTYTIDSYEVA